MEIFKRIFAKWDEKSSLLDKRIVGGTNKGKNYAFQNKPGRKSDYFEDSGEIIDDVKEG